MRTLIATLVVFSFVAPALAVDGVLEINQTCAVKTGCFAGDPAGFPVTIDGSVGSSFKLTSDLSVTAVGGGGIIVLADGITVNLADHQIKGPVICTGQGQGITCTPSSTTDETGIKGLPQSGVTIRNGRVTGFGRAIWLGDRARVIDVRADSNSNTGIGVGAYSLVERSRSFRNLADGIKAGAGTVIIDSVSSWNEEGGFDGAAMVVRNSAAVRNGGDGIVAGRGSVIVGNTVNDNLKGIVGDEGSIVSKNSVTGNTTWGILANRGTVVTDNGVWNNGGDGILAYPGSRIHGNTIRGNAGDGLSIRAGGDSVYRENVITENTMGGVVGGGVNMGDNYCAGTGVVSASCP